MIVEMSSRHDSRTRKILEDNQFFERQMEKSQVATYTLEYFTDCFTDTPNFLKAIHVKLYLFKAGQKPRIYQYVISWEDIRQKADESWRDFRARVDNKLRRFLKELNSHSKLLQGPIFQ